MTFFVGPSARAAGRAGQQVVNHLMTRARYSASVASAGGLTILAGVLLYWRDSAGFTSGWSRSGPGIGFGIGGVAAVVAFVLGIQVGRNFSAMGRLAAEITGEPTNEQAQRLAALQKSQARLSTWNAFFLITATALMAVSRYLVF